MTKRPTVRLPVGIEFGKVQIDCRCGHAKWWHNPTLGGRCTAPGEACRCKQYRQATRTIAVVRFYYNWARLAWRTHRVKRST